MRASRLPLVPSVLASTLIALLLAPVAVLAASGLPSTITMTPAAAGPGSTVEVVGLDFPAGATVDLQLTTTAGAVPLGTATVEDGGYFRQSVSFPTEVSPGFWELRASVGDAVAVTIFEATAGSAGPIEAATSIAATAAAGAAGPGGSDLIVLLVLAVLAGVIGGAGAFVWRQTHAPMGDPGMASGDDPIWSGASTESH